MKFRTSLEQIEASEEARATKELIQRHWHLASVGLGNCRAAQALKREIDRRTTLNAQRPAQAAMANSGTGVSPVCPPTRAYEAARAIKDLIQRDWHFTSVGLGNCRAAQANRRELNEQLLIQSAALANADFNSQEDRDRRGRWTTGGNSATSATNSPPNTPAPGAGNANSSDDDTDDIPLTYGGAHAKLRQSQSDASAKLYDKSGGEIKAVAATGRAAAEMNPIVAFFHGIYQALVGKDAIDSNKKLTTVERWKSAGSAAMAAAPTVLKAGKIAKVVVETDEVAQGLKKTESAIAETEKAAQGLKKAEGEAAGAAKATKDAEEHHIATDKNLVSTARGGPWTPKFEELFKKAGMTLQDGMNKISVDGHFGPHPEGYHQAVFKRLKDATEGLSGNEYTKAFKAELTRIGNEARTPGTELNKLITR